MNLALEYACQIARATYKDKTYNQILEMAHGVVSYASDYLDNPSGDTTPQREPQGELAKILGSKDKRVHHLSRIASLLEIEDNFTNN